MLGPGAGGEAPPSGTYLAPPVAADVFGSTLGAVERFASLLVSVGIPRGIVGPGEATRLWDRHLLNCALVEPLIPPAAVVVDVGSGGGLPGMVLALVRPDLRLVLIDSMSRRTTFLAEAVADLGVEDRVEVIRARAETLSREADVAVARAVADVGTVAGWTAGLCRRGGVLLVLRGDTADTDLAEHRGDLHRQGWKDAEVVVCQRAGVTPSRVIRAVRA